MRHAISTAILLFLIGTFLPARAQVAEVGLQLVARGLTSPVALMSAPDNSGRLFIIDQIGQIRIVTQEGTMLDAPFLDLSDRMVELNPAYDERGLLGLAFHPDYATNGRFFVYYSAPLRDGAPSDFDHTSHIAEFAVSSGDANRANADSERLLLQVDQPQGNHNAGTLAFGPDGLLYISLGDGGGADDTGTGHVEDWYAVNEGGNAQNVTANLLGKILRIDVDNGDPYGIPPDNPFVGRDGHDEIYAYGFRNPYRFSFDMGGDGELFVGDAGQNRWEEVDLVTRGGNYGWNVKEGAHCFNTDDPDVDRADCPEEVGAGHPDAGAPLIDPIIEYPNHKQEGGLGEVVVGGAVYRGNALPDLEGRYLFGDWSDDTENPSGRVFITSSRPETGQWPFVEAHFTNRPEGELGGFLLSFGQDSAGEIYVLTTLEAGPTGSTGQVFRLVPPEIADANEPGAELPGRVLLEQNYPNPFNPATTIEFQLERPERVTLKVFDLMGREVATLMDGTVPAGTHAAQWDGLTEEGQRAASGQYFYRLETSTRTETLAMTLLK